MKHSLLLAFQQTYEREFPLILVIGREPNNVSTSDNSFGVYEFKTKEQRRCALWNTSFSLIGLYNGLTSAQMKMKFEEKESSPILFVDASPKGIKNSVINKDAIRLTVTKDELKQHVDAIFINEKLTKRIKLVLFSGLEHTKYDTFKELFKLKAVENKIPIKEIPFLIGYNSKKIQAQINDSDIKVFKQVFEEFNDQKIKTTHACLDGTVGSPSH